MTGLCHFEGTRDAIYEHLTPRFAKRFLLIPHSLGTFARSHPFRYEADFIVDVMNGRLFSGTKTCILPAFL
jgi:hypothetical protein